MRSHDIHYPSLILGAIFTGLGIVLATGSLDVLHLDWPKVAGPITIIIVGLLIGMVALLRRSPEASSPATNHEVAAGDRAERSDDATAPIVEEPASEQQPTVVDDPPAQPPPPDH